MIDREELQKKIIEAERQYSLEFSLSEKTEYGLRFTDKNLPDMHCHNFLRIDRNDLPGLNEIIDSENRYRNSENQEAVQIEVFDCEYKDVKEIVCEEKLSEQIIMYCETEKFDPAPQYHDARAHIAESDADFAKGKKIDCLSFGLEYGEFSDRRFDRKLDVYKNRESNMNHFICCSGQNLLGNCDFFVFEKYGKIEDFDVIEEHQRNGYGRIIMQSVKEYASSQNVEILFLQVESDNSAMEMYRKMGFKSLFNNILYNSKVSD